MLVSYKFQIAPAGSKGDTPLENEYSLYHPLPLQSRNYYSVREQRKLPRCSLSIFYGNYLTDNPYQSALTMSEEEKSLEDAFNISDIAEYYSDVTFETFLHCASVVKYRQHTWKYGYNQVATITEQQQAGYDPLGDFYHYGLGSILEMTHGLKDGRLSRSDSSGRLSCTQLLRDLARNINVPCYQPYVPEKHDRTLLSPNMFGEVLDQVDTRTVIVWTENPATLDPYNWFTKESFHRFYEKTNFTPVELYDRTTVHIPVAKFLSFMYRTPIYHDRCRQYVSDHDTQSLTIYVPDELLPPNNPGYPTWSREYENWYNEQSDDSKFNLINYLATMTTVNDPSVFYRIRNVVFCPFSMKTKGPQGSTHARIWKAAYQVGLQPETFLDTRELNRMSIWYESRKEYFETRSSGGCSNTISPVYLEEVKPQAETGLSYNNQCFFRDEVLGQIRYNGNQGFGGIFPAVWTKRDLRSLLFLTKYVTFDTELQTLVEDLLLTLDSNDAAARFAHLRGKEGFDEWFGLLFEVIQYLRRWKGSGTPLLLTAKSTTVPIDENDHSLIIDEAVRRLNAHPDYEEFSKLTAYTRLVNGDYTPVIANGQNLTIHQRIEVMKNVGDSQACVRLTSNVLLQSFFFWLKALSGRTSWLDTTIESFELIG